MLTFFFQVATLGIAAKKTNKENYNNKHNPHGWKSDGSDLKCGS